MIHIAHYGLGNVKALETAFKRMDIKCVVATSSNELKQATHVIVPGVGSFDTAVGLLEKSGMRQQIKEMVDLGRCIVMGICVGMQIFGDRSEEGCSNGLSWIGGDVKKFCNMPDSLPVPHLGWNSIAFDPDQKLFAGLDQRNRFYFMHSYFFKPAKTEYSIAETDYGGKFASVIKKRNVYAVQFHPEKSHDDGYRLLKNFSQVEL